MNYIRAELQHMYEWFEPSQRVNDKHIMDVFLDSKEEEVEVMDILNYIRYDVKGTTLAEITTSDSKQISPKCFYEDRFQSKEEMCHRLDPDKWPQHGKTNKRARHIWRQALTATVCNEDGYLHTPLGKWLVAHKRWTHVSDGSALLRKVGEQWVAHAVKQQTRTK
eukprot:15337359-Ditylum_brightwellii.AAC.1